MNFKDLFIVSLILPAYGIGIIIVAMIGRGI